MDNIIDKITPFLYPSQFDEYIFSNWKPSVSGLYEKFHIERIENYKDYLKLPLLPHRRSVYFFIFLTKGNAVRSKGLNNYAIEAGQFFFLPANQITSLDYISPDIEGFYCHFTPEVMNYSMLKINLINDFSFLQFTGHPIIKVPNNEHFVYIISKLETEYRLNQSERFALIPVYLLALFTELNLYVKTNDSTNLNASTLLTQRYKNALSEYIYNKKSVIDFAELLAVSPNHLHKCVKATTGKTAHELLEEMRILESKVLLKQSSLSIGEIAFTIGKIDPSDFSRFFKSKTGQTPNQYRQNIK